MISIATFRQIVFSFEGVTEQPHMAVTSFYANKKIFVTLNEPENRCCVKLSPLDQSVFCSFDNTVIYAVPNAWGRHGWTLINLSKVRKSMLKDALGVAYTAITKKASRKKQ
jgi:hypothetical protein